MTQPKLWNERDFDECCFAVGGVGPKTMVCAKPCRGAYCEAHRREMDAFWERSDARKRMADKVRQGQRKVEMKLAPAVEGATTMAEIIAKVAAAHGITVDQLKNPRQGKASRPRQEAAYQIRKLGKSYPQIARAVGLKDHTSVIHACRAVERRLAAAFAQEAA